MILGLIASGIAAGTVAGGLAWATGFAPWGILAAAMLVGSLGPLLLVPPPGPGIPRNRGRGPCG